MKIEDVVPKQIESEITQEYDGNTGIITTKSLRIKTLEQALAEASVDMAIWEVDRYIINSWEVTMGKKNTNTERPETYTNWQVKAWLKRKIKIPLEIAIDAIEERMKTYAPTFPKIKRQTNKKERNLLEISLFDLHFGKLAWIAEVGHDYDVEIAEKYYINAVRDLLDRTKQYPIEKILFPIGQDFFHVNNPKGITPKGSNPLDVDGRLAKVFEAGEMAILNAIEYCRAVAPVKIIWIPGNHDPETSYYLLRVLNGIFKTAKDVEVDTDPKMRKYESYGINLIGYTHGDEEPVKELPRIMADEVPELWATSKFREIHIGHIHKKKEINFVSADSFGSTTVRVLPSLTGTDAWHYMKGYVKVDRAAQSFLWNYKYGLIGTFLTHIIPQTGEIKGEI